VTACATAAVALQVFVCDRTARAVLVFRASGAFEGYIGAGSLEAPYGVAFDESDGECGAVSRRCPCHLGAVDTS
jgi:hypothetical protein